MSKKSLGELKPTNLSLSPDYRAKLEQVAAAIGATSITECVRRLCDQYLQPQEDAGQIGRLAETSDYFLKLLRERIRNTLFGRKAVLRTDIDAMVNELEHELAAARKGGAE